MLDIWSGKFWDIWNIDFGSWVGAGGLPVATNSGILNIRTPEIY